jgi:hypothetical protein
MIDVAHIFSFRRRSKLLIAVLLAGLFALSLVLGASPALHGALHSDANNPAHQCAISLLAHGLVLPSEAAAALVPTISFLFCALLLTEGVLPSSADCRLFYSRGPPSSF